MNKKKFRLRIYTSFTLFIIFIALALSGLVMYSRPEGSVANWTGWTALGLTKKSWEGIHTIVSFTFIIFAVIHLILNIRTLLRYLGDKIAGSVQHKRELLVAFCTAGIILIAAVLHLPPFSRLIDLRGSIKNAKHLITVEAPSPDYEKQALLTVAESLDAPIETIRGELELHGIMVTAPEHTLQSIAKDNNMSPQMLYGLILRISAEYPRR